MDSRENYFVTWFTLVAAVAYFLSLVRKWFLSNVASAGVSDDSLCRIGCVPERIDRNREKQLVIDGRAIYM